MGEITVSDDSTKTLSASVTFVDAHGHPTTADDVPQWTSSDEAVATLAPTEDGLNCTVSTTSDPGSTVITVTSTNDDGSVVTSTGLVNVAPGDAVIGSIDFTEQ